MLKYIKIFSVLLISSMIVFNINDASANNKKSQEPLISKSDLDAVNTISQNMNFDEINKKISEIDNVINSDNFSKETIDAYITYLGEQETNIKENKKELDKQIKFLQKQIGTLGDTPKEGEEDIVITKQRETLTKEMTVEDRILKEADLILVKIEDLNVQALNARNKKIYGNLMNKQSALINPIVFLNSIKLYVIFFWDVVKSPIVWYQELPAKEKFFALFSIISVLFVLGIVLALSIFARKYVLQNWGYNKSIDQPSFANKVIAAFAVAIARGVIPASLIGGCILWMASTRIFSGSFLGYVLTTAAYMSLIAIVESTISRVTFAPNYPNWRLVNISNEKAVSFTRMIFFFIIFNTFAGAQVYLANLAKYSLETVHFLMTISCAIKAFFLMWFSKIFFDTYKSITVTENSDIEKDNKDEDEFFIDKKVKFMFISNIACIIFFAFSIFGYPELSSFILNRIISTLIIVGIFELFRRSIVDIIKRIIIFIPAIKNIKLGKKLISKIEFWIETIVNPVLVLLLVFSLLNLWGLPIDFVIQSIKKILFGFKVGGIEISLIAIAMGIGVFFASLTVVKIIRNKLTNSLLNKIDIDSGIKHSLVSGVSFIGFIISILFAIMAMGVDLTNLAVIAGALSVGIGFGLQDVIKNLVSGIIILFERPFKVGDWVIINSQEGKIKQINIRSTEMETFNRTSIIVPNATLLSSSVTNLTHDDNMARQTVKVGVAYGTDVDLVKELLLQCAKENKDVLKVPAPYVLFQDFGASSLDFELRYYVKDIWNSWTAPSAMRFAIYKKFNEYNIEIPFAQMVLYNGDKANELKEKAAAQKNIEPTLL